MGAQLSKAEDAIYATYKRIWPTNRVLAPSVLISVGSIGFVAYAFTRTKPVSSSPKVALVHLVGVAGGFGVSLWIHLVHDRSIQRMLTRQEHATINSNLSTVYFTSCSVLSSLSLSTFLMRHPFHRWSKDVKSLGIALILALIATQLNTLILDPLVTDHLFDRNQIEFMQSAKSHDDIEHLMRNDSQYRSVSTKYELLQSLSSLAGLIYHGVQWYHLFFLADRCLVL